MMSCTPRCSSRRLFHADASTICSPAHHRPADMPYRVAALAGFTSYAVGHNIGASAFTGGAVRYRIYSATGSSAIEVAKVCFIAGLTFWLGNATVLGLGVAIPPARGLGDQSAPALAQSHFACGSRDARDLCRLGVADAARGRPQQLGGHAAERAATLVQIAVGIIDLACCAAAMYMLVPDEPYIGFVTLAVIFVAGDVARICQPLARRPRGVRCRHAGRALAVRHRRPGGGTAAVPPALLFGSLRAGAGDSRWAGALAQLAWLAPQPWCGEAVRRQRINAFTLRLPDTAAFDRTESPRSGIASSLCHGRGVR